MYIHSDLDYNWDFQGTSRKPRKLLYNSSVSDLIICTLMSTFPTVRVPAFDWQSNLVVYPLPSTAVKTVSLGFQKNK